MWSAISGIVSGIVAPVANYFQRRAEIKLAAHQADLALVVAQGERAARLAEAGLAADASWEMAQLDLSRGSLRDEFVLLVLAAPLIIGFIKVGDFDGPAIVAAGFAALAATPLWYQGLTVAIFAATYGLRTWRRNMYDTETPLQAAAAMKASLDRK